MKIAILGTRGIPANYGGFETFAEECAAGLVARGHDVTVYCRSHYVSKSLEMHRGARLAVLPTLKWKYADTVVHTGISIFHALLRPYDLILICNAANSIYTWLPRIFGIPVVVNVDGIERLRRKWNWVGKTYYHLCEYLSTCFPSAIVTDAKVIERYYRDRYGAPSAFIPYGARTERSQNRDALEKLGLESGEYFLYVSRLEPENNAHQVVEAFEKVQTSKRLVIVGDAPYAARYIKRVRSHARPSNPVSRRRIWRRLPAAANACVLLHPCYGSRGDPSGAYRGHGTGKPHSRERDARKQRGAWQSRDFVPQKRCR